MCLVGEIDSSLNPTFTPPEIPKSVHIRGRSTIPSLLILSSSYFSVSRLTFFNEIFSNYSVHFYLLSLPIGFSSLCQIIIILPNAIIPVMFHDSFVYLALAYNPSFNLRFALFKKPFSYEPHTFVLSILFQ